MKNQFELNFNNKSYKLMANKQTCLTTTKREVKQSEPPLTKKAFMESLQPKNENTKFLIHHLNYRNRFTNRPQSYHISKRKNVSTTNFQTIQAPSSPQNTGFKVKDGFQYENYLHQGKPRLDSTVLKDFKKSMPGIPQNIRATSDFSSSFNADTEYKTQMSNLRKSLDQGVTTSPGHRLTNSFSVTSGNRKHQLNNTALSMSQAQERGLRNFSNLFGSAEYKPSYTPYNVSLIKEQQKQVFWIVYNIGLQIIFNVLIEYEYLMMITGGIMEIVNEEQRWYRLYGGLIEIQIAQVQEFEFIHIRVRIDEWEEGQFCDMFIRFEQMVNNCQLNVSFENLPQADKQGTPFSYQQLHKILYKLIFLKVQTVFGYRIIKCSQDQHNQSLDDEVVHDFLAVSHIQEQAINQNLQAKLEIVEIKNKDSKDHFIEPIEEMDLKSMEIRNGPNHVTQDAFMHEIIQEDVNEEIEQSHEHSTKTAEVFSNKNVKSSKKIEVSNKTSIQLDSHEIDLKMINVDSQKQTLKKINQTSSIPSGLPSNNDVERENQTLESRYKDQQETLGVVNQIINQNSNKSGVTVHINYIGNQYNNYEQFINQGIDSRVGNESENRSARMISVRSNDVNKTLDKNKFIQSQQQMHANTIQDNQEMNMSQDFSAYQMHWQNRQMFNNTLQHDFKERQKSRRLNQSWTSSGLHQKIRQAQLQNRAPRMFKNLQQFSDLSQQLSPSFKQAQFGTINDFDLKQRPFSSVKKVLQSYSTVTKPRMTAGDACVAQYDDEKRKRVESQIFNNHNYQIKTEIQNLKSQGYTKVISTRGQVFYYRNKVEPLTQISSTVKNIKYDTLDPKAKKKAPFRFSDKSKQKETSGDPQGLDQIDEDDKNKEDRVINIRTGKISNFRVQSLQKNVKEGGKKKGRAGTKSPKRKSKSPKRKKNRRSPPIMPDSEGDDKIINIFAKTTEDKKVGGKNSINDFGQQMSNPYIPLERFDRSQSAKSKSIINMSKDERLERKNTTKQLFKDVKIHPETPRQQDFDSDNDSKGSKYNKAQINQDIMELIKQEQKTSNFKDKKVHHAKSMIVDFKTASNPRVTEPNSPKKVSIVDKIDKVNSPQRPSTSKRRPPKPPRGPSGRNIRINDLIKMAKKSSKHLVSMSELEKDQQDRINTENNMATLIDELSADSNDDSPKSPKILNMLGKTVSADQRYVSQPALLGNSPSSSLLRKKQKGQSGKGDGSSGGILQKTKTQRFPNIGIVEEGYENYRQSENDQDARKSVTFDLRSPQNEDQENVEKDETKLSKVRLDTKEIKSDVYELKKELDPQSSQQSMSLEDSTPKVVKTQQSNDHDSDDLNDEIQSANATEGLIGNDMWRAHSSLLKLRDELKDIKNKKLKNFDQQSQLHDWFNTRIYHNVYESQIIEFNQDGDPHLFTSQSEIEIALQAMLNPHKRFESEVSFSQNGSQDQDLSNKPTKELSPKQIQSQMVGFYVKGINTLRFILRGELGMVNLYRKYILIHGTAINLETTSRLLIRCKLLLKGRKILTQILAVIVERNKLVNSLKQMIALDQLEEEQKGEQYSHLKDLRSQVVGDGDLGDYNFDQDLAKELGYTIVRYARVIQELVKQLISIKAFPGMRVNGINTQVHYPEQKQCGCEQCMKGVDGIFVFKGADLVKYIRKETNEIKHLLYIYKIQV